MGTGGDKGRKR